MKHRRVPIAAMVAVGAIVVAVVGAACSAPVGRQPFPASSPAGPTDQVTAPIGHDMSVESLSPGIAWAGLSYAATLVVSSEQPVTVANISVGVRSDNGTRADFPGMHRATVDGTYVFTSLPRQFAPGRYTEFGTYEINNHWYELPAQTLRVLAGPTIRDPNPAPVGIAGRWTSTLNAGPGFENGMVKDSVSDLMAWNGASGRDALPNNTYEYACYHPANVAMHGSLLGLSLTRPATSNCPAPADWAPEPLYGAQVSTHAAQDIKPGAAVEAEIYLPPAPDGTIADWPAFWLSGSASVWPTTGEIDIFEGLGGQGCYHFHWGTLDNVGSTGDCPSIGPGWHIFGLDWQPANRSSANAKPGADVAYRTTYYYDGRDVGSIVQGGVVKEPLELLLDITDKVPDPGLLPATMQVAYVRAWSGS